MYHLKLYPIYGQCIRGGQEKFIKYSLKGGKGEKFSMRESRTYQDRTRLGR
ncbi:hypothetical protein KDA_01750 [Dictyobacter alpinus]|uniref:Uncharacterized protein n=1 Tax=Dictyobacter alpinus TaxID=2014873 RepID=A0A402B008_9CHLR|nr:hypothetical protein KDA_01750 [Dictyobacter alpinus]